MSKFFEPVMWLFVVLDDCIVRSRFSIPPYSQVVQWIVIVTWEHYCLCDIWGNPRFINAEKKGFRIEQHQQQRVTDPREPFSAQQYRRRILSP